MNLMAKVNHLAWFKGPIFQESLVTTEIMYFINFQNWIQRSANSGKGYLGVNHGNPLSIISPGGPLNAVGPIAQPSIFLKRALKGSSLWCREEPIVFFSKIATIPPSLPVLALVLSTRIVLIVFSLLNSCKTSTTCSAWTVPVAPILGRNLCQIFTIIWCLLCKS